MTAWAIIGGMALVTFLVRYPVLAAVGRVALPAPVLRALGYVPAAVLTAIIAPAVLRPEGVLRLSPASPHLIGALAAALVSWRTRSLTLTIVIGMAVFLLWRAVAGG